MSALNVEVILKLVDQLSGPAQNAAKSLRDMVAQVRALGRSSGAESLSKNLTNATRAMSGMAAEMRTIQSSMNGLTAGARGFGAAVASSARQAERSFAGIPQSVIRSTREMARGLQQVQNMRARMTAPPPGGGGGGRSGGGNFAHQMAGMYGYNAAHRISSSVKGGVHGASDLQQEYIRLKLLGLSGDEQNSAIAAARKASSAVPQVSTADSLHSFREIRYALASTKEAMASLQDLNRFSVTLAGSLGKDKAEQVRDQVYSAAKSSEMLNQIKDHSEFKAVLDSIQRAATSSGGQVDAQKYFQALKYSRGAASGYDQEFRELFLPEYIQELASGGRRAAGSQGGAGTALAAFKRYWVDQQGMKQYAPELLKAGLLDPNKVHYNGKGKVVGLDRGAVNDSGKAGANPYRFITDNIIPALKRSGLDPSKDSDKTAINQMLGSWGGTALQKQFTAITALMDRQMQQRAEMTAKSLGVDSSYTELVKGWLASFDGMKTQFDDMKAHVFTSAMPILTPIQDVMASVFKKIKEEIQSAPALSSAVIGAAAAGIGAVLIRSLIRGGLARALLGGALGYAAGGGTAGALLGASALRGFGAAVTGVGAAATAAGAGLTGVARSLVSIGGLFLKGGSLAWLAALMALPAIKKDSQNGNKMRSIVREALGIEDPKEPAPWMPGGAWHPNDKKWHDRHKSPWARRGNADATGRSEEADSWFRQQPSFMDTVGRPATSLYNPHARRNIIDQPWPPSGAGGAVPFAPAPPTDMGSQGSQAMTSWKDGFLGAVSGTAEAFEGVKGAANINLAAQGGQSGNSWADAFLAAARKISGASIQGPSVTPGAPTGTGGGEKKESRASGNTQVAMVNHFHGHQDPHATAEAVHRKFRRSVYSSLSDGQYVYSDA